ncbi:hypothetical protein [Kitasatospora sp. NPDC087314]|uniref:hypothetical protein n=1 Tax=Kitasatospora sp. NPDC087314 TaxID=3364068 RepID=UPI0037F74579
MENTAIATSSARTKRSLRALAATAVAASALALNLVSVTPSSAAPNCQGVPVCWDHLTQGMCLRGGENMSSPVQYGSEGVVATEEANGHCQLELVALGLG